MNTKILIQDINRKRVPFCELKKYLSIEDDIKLVNVLIDVVEIGIHSLRCSIIRENFMYIIYSLQYLKILGKNSEGARIKITPYIKAWSSTTESMLKERRTKRITQYSSFLSDILDQLKCVLSTYKTLDVSKTEPKHLTFPKTIYKMVKNAEDIDTEKLTTIINTYITKYLSMSNERKQYESLKDMIYTLQNRSLNYKEGQKGEVIQQILSILKSYYISYHDTMMEEHKDLFDKYMNTFYIEDCNIFESWEISNLVEEGQPFIITIDSPYSFDLDDALAISHDSYGTTLHVYIADTTPFLIANPIYESVAFQRYSSLYFQQHNSQKAFHMLPQICAEDLLSLRENEWRNVVDYAFYIDNFGSISYEVSYKCIEVNKRLSYDQVNEMIKKSSESEMKDYLRDLEKYIQIIYKKMGLNKIYVSHSQNRAEELVSQAALLTNHMTAIEAAKKQYLLLYQDYGSGEYFVQAKENPYVKVTSPIRRYSDLKNNYLLHRFLEGNISDSEYSKIENELQNMLPDLEIKKEQSKYFSKVLPHYLNFKI